MKNFLFVLPVVQYFDSSAPFAYQMQGLPRYVKKMSMNGLREAKLTITWWNAP